MIDFDTIIAQIDAAYEENGVTSEAEDIFDDLCEKYPTHVQKIRKAIEDFYQISLPTEAQIRERWEAAYDIFQPLIIRKAVLQGQGKEVPKELDAHIQALSEEMQGYMIILGIER